MAWKKTTYSAVRGKMQPGDVIAFGGKGQFSDIIKWATGSGVSHVGVIMKSKLLFGNRAQKGYFNQVIESTLLNGFAGVTVSRLSDRLRLYKGQLWWLPLSSAAREKLKLKAFFDFCIHQKGKPYDVKQAIGSALDGLDKVPLLKAFTHNTEDFDKFFCSELVAAALEKGGVIKKINASEVTPIDLCRFALYGNDYFQFKGAKRLIRGYNALDPEGFGI